MIRRRILTVAPVALLLAFGLEASGSGNVRSDLFTIEGTTARVHWEVTPRDEGPMCYFRAHLVGLAEDGSLTSVDQVAMVDAVPRRMARALGLNERPSGDVDLDVQPGTYLVSIFGEHLREADGTSHGCESWRVEVNS